VKAKSIPGGRKPKKYEISL